MVTKVCKILKESAVLRRISLRPELVQVSLFGVRDLEEDLVEDGLVKEQVYSGTSHSDLGTARSHATRQCLLMRGESPVARRVFYQHDRNIHYIYSLYNNK